MGQKEGDWSMGQGLILWDNLTLCCANGGGGAKYVQEKAGRAFGRSLLL